MYTKLSTKLALLFSIVIVVISDGVDTVFIVAMKKTCLTEEQLKDMEPPNKHITLP